MPRRRKEVVVRVAAQLYVELAKVAKEKTSAKSSKKRALATACVRAVLTSFGLDDDDGYVTDVLRKKATGGRRSNLHKLNVARTERIAEKLEMELLDAAEALKRAKEEKTALMEATTAAKAALAAVNDETQRHLRDLEICGRLGLEATKAAETAESQLDAARSRCAVAFADLDAAQDRLATTVDATNAAQTATDALQTELDRFSQADDAIQAARAAADARHHHLLQEEQVSSASSSSRRRRRSSLHPSEPPPEGLLHRIARKKDCGILECYDDDDDDDDVARVFARRCRPQRTAADSRDGAAD